MAIKISELPSATTITGFEVFPLTQSGTTLQTSVNSLLSYNTINIPFSIQGMPATGQVYNYALPTGISLPANFAGASVYASTIAAANAIFTVNKISSGTTTAIGTITITGLSQSFTLSTQIQQFFADGDTLQIVAPTQDATLADISITFSATIAFNPSLDISFVNGSTFDSRITFTRSSTGTYYDINGVIQSATSNVPRYEYDPVTHALNGVLNEGQCTNSLTWNQDPTNGVWSTTAATLQGTTTTIPTGSSLACLYLPTNTAGEHRLTHSSFAITASAYFNYSGYFRQAGIMQVRLNVYESTSRAKSVIAIANLETGTIATSTATGGFTALASTIQNVGNGWWRASISGQIDASTTTVVPDINFCDTSGNISWTPNGTDGLYTWGWCLETGQNTSVRVVAPTSIILTTSGSVTRSQDLILVPAVGWYSATKGTVVAECIYSNKPNGNGSALVGLVGSNRDQDFIAIAMDQFANTTSVASFTSAVNRGITSTYLNYTNVVLSAGFTYTSSAISFTTRGQTPLSASISATPIVTNLEILGLIHFQTGLNGYARRIRYWPRVLSNTELQQATA